MYSMRHMISFNFIICCILTLVYLYFPTTSHQLFPLVKIDEVYCNNALDPMMRYVQ